MPNPIQPYIEFREVSKAFGDKVVLDRVSFNVMPGETVCILGRSGVGKSVSLQLIVGFLKADSGRVIVAGEDVNLEQLTRLSNVLGRTLQRLGLKKPRPKPTSPLAEHFARPPGAGAAS